METPEEIILRLTQELENAKEKEVKDSIRMQELESNIAKLDIRVEDLESDVAERDILIDQLNNTVAANDKAKTAEFPVVSHEGKTYEIVLRKFRIGSDVKTASDVQNDPALLAELLEAKSGVLRLFKEKEAAI